MSALSRIVVEAFCNLCDWTNQVWLNHIAMFDENPRASELQQSIGAEALLRLYTISHEYSLLQIAKLHDPAVVSGQVTLSIEYIVKYGGWEQPIYLQLTELSTKLNTFGKRLHTLRNKALAHNDLAAILSGSVLGEFSQGEDVKYFEVLQEFVNVVHEIAIGGVWPFDNLVQNDVTAFMSIIKS